MVVAKGSSKKTRSVSGDEEDQNALVAVTGERKHLGRWELESYCRRCRKKERKKLVKGNFERVESHKVESRMAQCCVEGRQRE